MSAIADSQRPYLTPMPQAPELEALPTAGSLVGRHLIVREISRGTIGPLFLARTQNENEAVDTLARVIPIPPDLPAKDDQLVAEAIWDSANVGHDMVLRVADVVAGKGWVTLIHDHQPGSMLSSMHWRASDVGSPFPSEVAARIALDVLDGLEQSRSLCDSNGVPWRSGGIAIGSLYLCGDGRTRALDGQVMAAVMRSATMRALAGTPGGLPPEMLEDGRDLDQRADVFAVGALLWQLLTGRELSNETASPFESVSHVAPNGTLIPPGLESAVQQALELDRERRQTTLRELAVALVMGAEKVATYQQVVDFAGSLMPFEMAFRTKVIDTNVKADASLEIAPAQQPSSAQIGSVADQQTDAAPIGPAAQPEGRHNVGESLPSSTSIGQTPETGSSADGPRPDDSAIASKGRPSPAIPATDSEPASKLAAANHAASTVSGTVGHAISDAPAIEAIPSTKTELASSTIGQASKAAVAQLEQIDWPDEERAVPSEPFKKSNGKSAHATPLTLTKAQTTSRENRRELNDIAAKRTEREPSRSVDVSPVIELKSEGDSETLPEHASAKAVHRESARPTSHRSTPAATASHSAPRASSRPAASRPVQAQAAVASDQGSASEEQAPRKTSGGLQISATTLILGFSTTVLAVILIMLLLQQKPGPSAPAVNTVTSQFATAASALQQPELVETNPAPTQRPALPVATATALSQSGKATNEAQAVTNEARVDRPKRSSKASTKAGKEDGAADNAKPSKKAGQFVPDEI